MSEWVGTNLGEYVKSISETYRFEPNEEVIFLNTSDIYAGKVLNNEFENSSNLPGQAKKRICKGDILFSEIRPANGRYAKVNFDAEKYVVSTKLMVLRCDKNIYTDYFYLFITSKEQTEYLQMLAEDRSGTFPQITYEHISSIDILLPPLPEQKAIANVLSSLDDKIDLLHRQNKTLEAMAETLFRQWFIEEAKEDWEYIELGTVVETMSGGTPSRSKMEFYENGTINWVKSKELSGSFILDTEELITVDAVKKSSAKLLPANSVLIAMYGATVGEYGLIDKEMACNQAICALKDNKNYPYCFLFMYVKCNKEELINMAVGSAQQNISQILIKKLLVPNCYKKIAEYSRLVEDYFNKIKINSQQIQTLEKLRDNLLPKLMSGEVRVSYEQQDAA